MQLSLRQANVLDSLEDTDLYWENCALSEATRNVAHLKKTLGVLAKVRPHQVSKLRHLARTSSCNADCQIPAMTAKVLKQQRILTSNAVDDWKDGSQVVQFYQDRVVFITGGTGFIGKVLLEKLLRSCPGLKRVYLLVRSKRGENPQARLEKMLSSQMFEPLRQEQPDAFAKVTALAGDLREPNLGLSAFDQATLVDSVSVVFHSGAAVRFDEPLRCNSYDRPLVRNTCVCDRVCAFVRMCVSFMKCFNFREAVELNVLGTKRVLDLCRNMRNLCVSCRTAWSFSYFSDATIVFVHVSTAYCNSDKRDVCEVIYPSPVSAEELIAATQSAKKDATGPKEPCLFGLPNTYTLTKRVTESLVLEERGDIPVAIVRPSIVTASIREPLPGWLDNYNGCTGMLIVVGLGMLQSVLAEKNNVFDFIPVDVVANMLICVAWHTAETRPEHIEVYHCASGALLRQTWADLADLMQPTYLQYPLPNAIRFPKFHMTNSQLWHSVNLWCLHYVPACVADLALQLCGQKPRFLHLHQKICKGMNSLQHFMTHEWLFRSDNALRLQQELSPTDAQLFSFNLQGVDLSQYARDYMLGIRKYLLKAEDSELPEARKRLRRLNVLRWSWYLVLAVISWGVVAMLMV
ncbi:fatty acyl-CoA reductase 1-like [Dermacentor variabilis]|uniref:fatty acyl-CoA reductase 1-like n=1 Tax=Dermacentor variabilis TaxID=34621 RepID=UPI003F5BB21A